MSNTEELGATITPIAKVPPGVGYRTLAETPLGRMIAPERATVTFEIANHPTLSAVRMDVELVDRRYEIMRLEALGADGRGLTLQAIADLMSSLSMALRFAIEHRVKFEAPDGAVYSADRPVPDAGAGSLWAVALTYSVALAVGANPTAAVADELELSPGAAAQRVKRARDRGFLPATTPGKAS